MRAIPRSRNRTAVAEGVGREETVEPCPNCERVVVKRVKRIPAVIATGGRSQIETVIGCPHCQRQWVRRELADDQP